MTTSTRSAPHFTVRSGSSSARALFIAALCAFIVTAFLVDVQRGASPSGAPAQVELRT
jgi:hypothetical protein